MLWPEVSARQAYPLYYGLAAPFVRAVSVANPARGLNLFSAIFGAARRPSDLLCSRSPARWSLASPPVFSSLFPTRSGARRSLRRFTRFIWRSCS